MLVGSNLPQDTSHDLGRTCLGKARDNLHVTRMHSLTPLVSKQSQLEVGTGTGESAYKEGLWNSKASNLGCNQLLKVLDYLILWISDTVLENHKGIHICRAE